MFNLSKKDRKMDAPLYRARYIIIYDYLVAKWDKKCSSYLYGY